MLKVLRDNLKYLSWILWLVILVFIAFVFVDFGSAVGQGRGPANAAVTVGNDRVSHREFQRQYRQLEEQYRQAFGDQWSADMADRMRLPAQVLEQLVNRRLMVAEARDEGLRVSDEDVRKAILELPFLRDTDGRFVGEQEYRNYLARAQYTAGEFESLVREDLLLQRFGALVASSVAVSESELERAWRERNERASIRYALVPTSRHLGDVTVDEATVEAFYREHADEFRLPDQRVVDYLLVDTARLRSTITVDPADVERTYAERRSQYETPEQVTARHILVRIDDDRSLIQARSRIAEIRRKLDAGEAFAALAAEYSDDPGSRDQGGSLGAFGRGQMVPEFEEAAFSAQPGEIVGPVQTSFGLHLIEVEAKTPARTRTLAEVEPALRSELALRRAEGAAESRARELADRISNQSIRDEEGWKALADGQTVLFLTTPPFGRGEVVPGVGRNPLFEEAAFDLAEGAASAPVQTARGFAILRLREVRPAHLPDLSEIEARVRAAAQRDAAARQAGDELDRARAAVGAGGLAAVAQRVEVEVQTADNLRRSGTVTGLGSAQAVLEAAFELPVGGLGGPYRTAQGSVLVEVVSRAGFDRARFEADKDSLRDELRSAEADRSLRSVLARRRDETPIDYDRQLLDRLGVDSVG